MEPSGSPTFFIGDLIGDPVDGASVPGGTEFGASRSRPLSLVQALRSAEHANRRKLPCPAAAGLWLALVLAACAPPEGPTLSAAFKDARLVPGEGVSVARLIDDEVQDLDGTRLGEVENVIFDANGRAVAIVVESGGLLDFSKTSRRVAWHDVRVPAVGGPVVVDIAAPDQRFPKADTAESGQWAATDLLSDFVCLPDLGVEGYVHDLIVGEAGVLDALIAQRHSNIASFPQRAPYFSWEYGWLGAPPARSAPSYTTVVNLDPVRFAELAR